MTSSRITGCQARTTSCASTTPSTSPTPHAASLMIVALALFAASTVLSPWHASVNAQQQVQAEKHDKNVVLHEDFEGDKPRTPLEDVGRGWENVSKKNDGIVPKLCVGTGRGIQGQALGYGTGGKKHLWTNVTYRKPVSHQLAEGKAYEVSFMIAGDPTHKYARFYQGSVTLISGDARIKLHIRGKDTTTGKPQLLLISRKGDQDSRTASVPIKDQATADGRGFYHAKMIVTPDKTTLVTSTDGQQWVTTDTGLDVGLAQIDHVELTLYPIGYWSGMDEVKVKTIPTP